MENYHLFAWQGFSCDIPADWNLSEYNIVAGVSCARFFDDFNRRLDFEWMYVRHRIKNEEVSRRYDKIAASMRAAGAKVENIEDMPGGWSACLYSLPDGKRLMAAFRLVPENNFFCLLKMYFEHASMREAERIVRRIAGTFKLHEHGLIPWAVYDINFQLRKEFKLVATSFKAGHKLMVFEWRLRRLYFNFFSLADTLCKNHSMEKWCTDYLKNFKAISGVMFSEGSEGEIVAMHNLWRLWGNVEPLARGCLRYKAWCLRLPEKNQIFLAVFNYRGHEDVSFMENSLDPDLRPHST